MIRLQVILAIVFSLACTCAFGQQNAWQRIHSDQFNSGQGLADGSNSFGQWEYQTTGAIDSSPAIDVNWNVYFGTKDGYLISLDEHGKLRWKFKAGGEVFSPAIGSDQNVYVGSADGNMYAISASSGSVIWQFKAKGAVRTTPVFDKAANVVFGSDDHNCYSLNISNGNVIAKGVASSSITLSPAWAGGYFSYFVTDDGNLIGFDSIGGGISVLASNSAGFSTSPVVDPRGGIIVGSLDSNIYEYNGNTVAWSFKAASAITSTPAIGPDGTLYFGTQGGTLYAYNHAQPTNPQVNWTCTQPTGPIHSSPALGDAGVVYFGCDDGRLYATQYPGNVVWQVNAVGSAIKSSPAIAFDGTIMVGAENSTFYAIGTQSPVPVASVSVNPASVVGGISIVGTVTLTQSAPAGGDIVNLRESNESTGGVPPFDQPLYSSVPPLVLVPQFQTSVQFPIATSLPPAQTTVYLYAVSGFTIVKTSFVVQAAPLTSWQVTPSTVIGGNVVSGTATISEPAGVNGEIVVLSGGHDIFPMPVPVLINPGSQVIYVAIEPGGVDSTVTEPATATAGGVSLTVQVTILPADLVSITLLPIQVVGGVENSVGTINLNGLPGPMGALVNLSSSDTTIATVPSTSLVYIDPQGNLHNTFTVTSLPVVSNKKATITASYKKVQTTADLTVTPPQLASFSINPNSVLGGQTSTGTVNLSSITPSGGVTVQLATQDSDIQMPSSVTVTQGNQSASFTITSYGVPSTEVQSATASWDGVTMTATLTLQPPTVQSLSVGPSVVVGGSNTVVKGSVTLSGASNPLSGKADVVKLSSSDTTVAVVPATVTVASGASSASFQFTTSSVASVRSVTITATFNNTTQTATITVSPVQIAGVAVSPAIVGGGSPSLGQVAVTTTAGAAGYVVNLSTDNVDASVPKTVQILAGTTVSSFPITTKIVTKQVDVRISGTYSTSGATAILTLMPTTLGTLTIAPLSLVGGNNATGTVTLNGAASSPGLKVSLSSSSGDATVPGTVTVPTGATSTTFVIKTKGVASTVVAVITAKLAKNTATAKLTIQPAPLQSISLSTGTVIGGSSTVVTGTVTLAGFGSNTVVTLSSSNSSAASVPSSVKVPSGKSSATFTVTHFVVSGSQTVTITASCGGITEKATLTVNPMQVVGLTLTPTSVVGGKTSNGVVTLNAPVGSKAVVVSLSAVGGGATVPATVSVGSKQTTGKFTVKTVRVTSNTSSTIKATLGTSSASATLTIQK